MKELELRVGDLKLVISSVGNGVKAVKGNMVEDLGFLATVQALTHVETKHRRLNPKL